MARDTFDKAVLRYLDGQTLKGYLKNFSDDASEVNVELQDGGGFRSVPLDDLKAIFFVKTFEGDRHYNEARIFRSPSRELSQKIFVRFKDRESIVGFVSGKVPWDRGFHLDRTNDKKGFFVAPVDEGSNNSLVYVVLSSVEDVTVMVK